MWFNTAMSGLTAASTSLNTISNNIANSSTIGFKGSRTEFGDIFRWASYGVASDNVGMGVRVQDIAQQFTQGTLQSTGNVLDMAIMGDGFFTMNDNGRTIYTRAGNFTTDANGYVVNPMGYRLQVYPPVSGTSSFNTGTLQDLQLSTATSPPSATTSLTMALNLPSDATAPENASFSPTDPTSYNETTSMTVYDSLGAAHTQSMYFVRDTVNGGWVVHTTIDGNEVGTGTALTFDESGNILTPADGQIVLPAYTAGNGSAPMNLSIDVSDLTQYGEDFSVGSLTQDGYTAGQLWGIEVTQDGIVQARYTNGQVTPLGQLAMASFANPQGLQQLGDASWGQTAASGAPVMGSAGSGTLGSVQSGALEQSNVDLTQQLVDMMTAQRTYQANSQVISTSDQLMQEILNLR